MRHMDAALRRSQTASPLPSHASQPPFGFSRDVPPNRRNARQIFLQPDLRIHLQRRNPNRINLRILRQRDAHGLLTPDLLSSFPTARTPVSPDEDLNMVRLHRTAILGRKNRASPRFPMMTGRKAIYLESGEYITWSYHATGRGSRGSFLQLRKHRLDR